MLGDAHHAQFVCNGPAEMTIAQFHTRHAEVGFRAREPGSTD